ncbi:MAG: outer membrane protein assembly factor BamA [Rhodospirillales bacterium]|nr:outer membrane protein assembly factor BamA [Rhodospirillales bacterium]MCW8861849.1 outer membrane protein assembly factor BamA [Rhodospirillales bacterium]MCW8953168.1 outer membrane protein assembly factor BamA [Rhodospirillales bacterium]MCW8969639.1 outer membrane protein assembly factor BamA [Rhodospirillales bacterium]
MREIVIEGSQRIEAETVRSYMVIQEGDLYDRERVDRSLKSLFATGLFADVSLGHDGDRLTVRVVENPVINRIAFEGNRKLNDEALEAEVSLRPRVIYTRTKVQTDVDRLLTIYRRSGRFAATVTPKVIRLPQNRVDLVFEINEGDVTEIKSIKFLGNEEFGDGKLKDVVRTRETRWYRFFSVDDNYDPDRVTFDRELLRRFYLKEGFADFRVKTASAELSPNRDGFFLTYVLDEGIRYEFGKVDLFVGLKGLDAEQVRSAVEIETGDWYDADAIDKDVISLTNAVGDLGFPFIEVRPRVKRNREEKTIDIVYEINEGPRIFVERIDIKGNFRTQDSVIRREFRLVEGDAFNSAKFKRSNRRIQNLDFFDKVSIEQVPGSSPDKTVIDVVVEEKSTGTLSLGAGYSTANGPMADFGIRERNLLGKGQDLKLNLTIAAEKSQVDLGFTEPFFMDREVAAGFDVFHVRRDLQDQGSYDSKVTGGDLRIGYPITEDLYQKWTYTLKQSNIINVDSSASRYIKAQEGSTILSEVSHVLSYDKRDSRVAPTEGYYIRMVNDLAGLGGNSRYLRNQFSGGKYYPLGDDWVLSFTGTAGHILGIGQDVRLSDRFFLGGDDLRGFATAGVGPRDKGTDDSLGGEWMYAGTAEVSFPLGLPSEYQILGKLFTDLGSSGTVNPSGPEVSDTGALRASIGTGVSWNSPFGLIGVDLGFPVLKDDDDITEIFRINFGARF